MKSRIVILSTFDKRGIPVVHIVSKIEEKLKVVRGKIGEACARANRNAGDVKLIVVTKSASLEAVKEVIRLGETDLGENRVQQLKKVASEIEEFLLEEKDKVPVSKEINWHMIGHLQRNKVKQVIPVATLIHSVDTLRLAEEISTAAQKMNVNARVLLQVNTSQESQKYGVPVGAATYLAEQIETLGNLRLCGLMTMAPLTHNKDVIRSCFARAYELFSEIKSERLAGPEFTQLSMGMSNDYEIAIEEGATILRIGSGIFAG